jgi:hypothetical protein
MAPKRQFRSWLRRGIGMTAMLAGLLSVAAPVRAESAPGSDVEIVYPSGAGITNVVTDAGVDNTGKVDATAKLQELIKETSGSGRRVLYFPKGTYLVSDSLCMKIDRRRTDASHSHGPRLIGESRSETVIRLKDGTWPQAIYKLPMEDDGKPVKQIDKQVVLNTGDCTNTTFNKYIRNLTVNTGKNNGGAIGIQYNTSNIGALSEVDIVSEDGRGVAGLALAGVENGPGQIRDVTIRGFDVGVYSVSAYSMACSDITIEGALKAGLLNFGKTPGDNWTIKMAADAPAIVNRGVLSLLGVRMSGPGSKKPAVIGGAMTYLRGAQASGFARVIEAAEGTELKEYYTGKPGGLFHDAKAALALPVKRQPSVPYEKDFTKWASPNDYGAKGDGKTDDSDALEKALNEPGKTHIMVSGRHKITRPVKVGPDVVRIVGAGRGSLVMDWKKIGETHESLVIGDGKSPVLIVDDLNVTGLQVQTDRTVVLNSCDTFAQGTVTTWFLNGGGEVFISNTDARFAVNNPRARVWVRHYNAESNQDSTVPWANVMVKAGQVWVLGWKSESLKRRMIVEKGGAAEVIGFSNYCVASGNRDGDWPIFDVIDGQFGLVALTQAGSQHNKNIVWETRDGVKKVFDVPANGGNKNCVLYTGYDPAKVPGLRQP